MALLLGLASACSGSSNGENWMPGGNTGPSQPQDGVSPGPNGVQPGEPGSPGVNPSPGTSVPSTDGNVAPGGPVSPNGTTTPSVDASGNPIPGVVPNPDGSTDPVSPQAPDTPGAPPIGMDTDPAADPSLPAEPLATCDTPGPRTIRRLTAKQYHNTLVDLFGRDDIPREEVLSDPAVNGFHIDADALQVRDLTGELLMNYAEQVAKWATTEGDLKYQISPCTSNDESCYRQFVEEFGAKAFRQPLTADQITTYVAMMTAEKEVSFEAGMEVVLTAMLQSPYLVYRREVGESDGQGQYKLTPWEIASQLSYFLTDSPPDQELRDAAAQGRLETPEDIEREANRLLATDRAQGPLRKFVQGWLEIDGLPSKAKDTSILDLSDSLRQAMLRETEEFFLDLFYNDGTIGDLYAADHTFVNGELASLYGLQGGGSDFQKVSIAGTTRATGVLGQGAFLTQHALPENSSPVQRGIITRERLLCQDLPPVPENLDTNLEAPAGFKSNRERYQQHSADPTCAGCHSVIDPLGFSFENYDAFGRYREMDMGAPIDASGELNSVVGGPVPLTGLQDLNNYLAISDAARSCVVRYWTYYAYGKDTWDQKVCNHDAVRAAASEQGYTLKATLLAMLKAPHFTRRVD